MKTIRHIVIAVATVSVVASCDLDPVSPLPSEQLVVLALLEAGSPIDSIRITRTMPPEGYYAGISQDRVSGALVVLTHDGIRDTLPEVGPGYYGDGSLVARPGGTYSIDLYEGGHHLSAETVVPEPITISRVVNFPGNQYIPAPDTLLFPQQFADPDLFRSDGSIPERPITVTWDEVQGAAGYEFAAIAQDTTGVNFLRKRTYERWLDGEYRTASSREWQRMVRYPAFEGEMSSDLLWAALNYRGDHIIVIFARDRSYNDFVRTVSQGNTGNDYDTGTVMYVRGGLGLFGSYSSDTLRVYVRPEWLPSEHL